MDRTWTRELLEQLTSHWDGHVRPRLSGLSDEEYFWEPSPDCWSIRPRGVAVTQYAAGGGDLVIDWDFPEPTPAPLTTIAWRLGHVTVGLFALRNAAHFGGPPIGFSTAVWPEHADDALADLDAAYGAWVAGVGTLDDEGLARAMGPAESGFADLPLRALVLHINREAIHHLAEVLLLRDLYRATQGA